MDLPEIRIHVASHMCLPDLVACIQVSKSWHNTFISFIYKALDLNFGIHDQFAASFERPLSDTALDLYGSLIKSLTITLFTALYPQCSSTPQFFINHRVDWLAQCPELEKLSLIRLPDCPPFLSAPLDLSLLDQCSSLERLMIDGWPLVESELADILTATQKLTALRLCRQTLGRVAFDALTSLFPTLSILHIQDCRDLESWMPWEIFRSCPRLLDFTCPVLEVDGLSVLEEEENGDYNDHHQPSGEQQQQEQDEVDSAMVETILVSGESVTSTADATLTVMEPRLSTTLMMMLTMTRHDGATTTTAPEDSWCVCADLCELEVSRLIWSQDVDQNMRVLEQLVGLRALECIRIHNMDRIFYFSKQTQTQDLNHAQPDYISQESQGQANFFNYVSDQHQHEEQILRQGARVKPFKKCCFSRSELEHDPDLTWIPRFWPKLRCFEYFDSR
ncbi:hypothetical protein BGZ83_001215 [Gryganskiella cystojenkinii]|nr:hypothetical protein BGZ83_001215 [Gryganskiella cystojenkinii]